MNYYNSEVLQMEYPMYVLALLVYFVVSHTIVFVLYKNVRKRLFMMEEKIDQWNDPLLEVDEGLYALQTASENIEKQLMILVEGHKSEQPKRTSHLGHERNPTCNSTAPRRKKRKDNSGNQCSEKKGRGCSRRAG